MHLPDSILTALHSPFLLDAQAMQGFMLQVVQVVTGKLKAEDLMQARSRAPHAAFTPHAAALGTQGYQSLDEVPAGSIAVHQVSGVMLPDDSWFGAGTRTLGQAIQAADAHPNIVAHVGVFNTPGGSTQGLEDFAASIAATNKPFVGLASQACSAGYWSICGADQVMLAGRTAMMGSIGTKAEFLDFTGFFEQMGIKQVSVLATKSVNKNKSFDEAKAGNPQPLQAEILDPLNEVFLDTVLEARGDKIPTKQQGDVLSGLVFVGQACLDQGLADCFGSFDDAVALAQQLASSASTSSSTTSSNMGIFGNKNPMPAAMLALVGAATVTAEMATAANAELAAGGITGAVMTPTAAFDEMQAAVGQLATMTAERDAALATAKGLTDALAAAGAPDVAALVASRDEWKGKAEAYGAQPGAMGTSAQKEGGDKMGDDSPATASQKAIDELPHNKALENHPLFN